MEGTKGKGDGTQFAASPWLTGPLQEVKKWNVVDGGDRNLNLSESEVLFLSRKNTYIVCGLLTLLLSSKQNGR